MGNDIIIVKQLQPKGVANELSQIPKKLLNKQKILGYLKKAANQTKNAQKYGKKINKFCQIIKQSPLLTKQMLGKLKLIGNVSVVAGVLLIIVQLCLQQTKISMQKIAQNQVTKALSKQYIMFMQDRQNNLKHYLSSQNWQSAADQCVQGLIFVKTRYKNKRFQTWNILKPQQYMFKLMLVLIHINLLRQNYINITTNKSNINIKTNKQFIDSDFIDIFTQFVLNQRIKYIKDKKQYRQAAMHGISTTTYSIYDQYTNQKQCWDVKGPTTPDVYKDQNQRLKRKTQKYKNQTVKLWKKHINNVV